MIIVSRPIALAVILLVLPVATAVAADKPGAHRAAAIGEPGGESRAREPERQERAREQRSRHEGGHENEEAEAIRSRYEWMHQQRAFPGGIPSGARHDATRQRRSLPTAGPDGPGSPALTAPGPSPFSAPPAAATPYQWALIGPKPIADPRNEDLSDPWSGRVSALAPDPSDSSTIYAGAASGGVWKTTNAGASWKPLTDTLDSLAIGAVAVQPGASGVVLAGTGEPNFSLDSYYGTGIFRSPNGGTTWSKATTNLGIAGCHVSDIIFKPDQPAVVFAGVLDMSEGAGCANPGVYRSSDGGASFTRVFAKNVTDLAVDPQNGTQWYVAAYNDGIYKFDDSGTLGAKLTIAATGSTAHQRIAIAIAPSDHSRMYAAFTDSAGTFAATGSGIYTSATGPDGTWSEFTAKAGSTPYYSTDIFAFPWYALALTPDRSDANVLYVGSGPFLVRFAQAGGAISFPSFSASSDRIHADVHAVAFAGSRLWIGTDGGVYSTDDGFASVQNRNSNLALTQFNPGASVSAGGVLAGGTQDNGSLKTGSVLDWPRVMGCDGGWGSIHPTNPLDYVLTPQAPCLNGFVFRTTDGGTSAPSRADSGISTAEGGLFYSPLVAAPNDSSRLYYGRTHLWVTTNRGSGSNAWSSFGSQTFGAPISAIGATSDPLTVYVGTRLGHVWATAAGSGGPWADRDLGGYVTDVAADPGNPAIAYATVSGFGHVHAFKTVNSGGTWTPILASSVLDSPANGIAVDWRQGKGQIYVATDVGTLVSSDGGTTWEDATPGMPAAVATDVAVDPSMDRLVVWTHGRGVWAAALGATPPDTAVAGGPAEGSATSAAGAAFALAATPADGATFQCKLDDAAFETCPSAPSFSGLLEGPHTFQARATSPGGSDQSPATRTWTVDVTPPDTTIDSGPLEGATVDGGSATFGASSAEPDATFACKLDGAASFTACTPPVALSGLSNGAHTFSVQAIDRAGNPDPTPAVRHWTVTGALEPPEISISAIAAFTNSTSVSFDLAGTPAGATFRCKLDTQPDFSDCASPYSATGLADGEHSFSALAHNAAGDGAPRTVSWTVDTLPPETTITGAPAAISTSPQARFTFDSSEPGSTFTCSLDSVSLGACASPAVFTVAAGDHVFSVAAADRAGNADPSPARASWTFSAPAVTPPVTPPRTIALSCSIKLARKLSARKLNKGLTVTYRCSRAATAAFTLKLGSKKVATGKGSRGKLRLKARRRQRKAKRRLKLTVVFSAPGAASLQVVKTAKLGA